MEAYQSLLALVTYQNRHPEPDNATRIVQFYVSDPEDTNSLASTRVQMLLLNDNAPVLTNRLSRVNFTEGQDLPVSLVSDNLTLTDDDHNQYFFMSRATLQLSPVPISPQEYLSVDTEVLPPDVNVTQSYEPLTGRLMLEGEASVSAYQDLLRTATYWNGIEEPPPGTRLVTMQVYDGSHLSNIERVMVSVILINDRAPEVSTSNASFVFTERTRPVSLSDGLTLTDPDSGSFLQESVTLIITNAFDAEQELLNVTTSGDVTASFEPGGMVESENILFLLGPASVSDFQATLSTLTYTNLAEEPSPETRIITVLASDGDFNSTLQNISVEIQLINDLPVVATPPRETVINYVEGDGPVLIAGNLTLSDNDHTHLTLATVIIRNLLDSPDELLNLTVPNGTNMSSSYEPSTGVLMLSGRAELADYQDALRSLTYENLQADPGLPSTQARMIDILVFDGVDYSSEFTLTLTFDSVNDAPRLDLNGPDEFGTNFSTVFVEEGPGVGVASGNAILFDVDNSSLAYLNVTILNRFDGSDEVLSLALNLPEDEEEELVYAWYEDGSLLVAGLGSVENFQAALIGVTYRNLADEPDYTTRLVVVTASDGLLESEPYFTHIGMTPVNDPPRLIINGKGETGVAGVPPPNFLVQESYSEMGGHNRL